MVNVDILYPNPRANSTTARHAALPPLRLEQIKLLNNVIPGAFGSHFNHRYKQGVSWKFYKLEEIVPWIKIFKSPVWTFTVRQRDTAINRIVLFHMYLRQYMVLRRGENRPFKILAEFSNFTLCITTLYFTKIIRIML